MKPRVGLLTALGLGAMLVACGGSEDVPYPSDAALLERFQTHREAFDEFAANPENQEGMAALGITQSRVLPNSGVELLAWYHDLPGPGGCAKGYVYLPKPPRSEVAAIEDRWGKCPPEEAELFRPIEGNWYLFLRASN